VQTQDLGVANNQIEKREEVKSSNTVVTCILSVASSIKGESLSADVRSETSKKVNNRELPFPLTLCPCVHVPVIVCLELDFSTNSTMFLGAEFVELHLFS
jgi:hypothetical protein